MFKVHIKDNNPTSTCSKTTVKTAVVLMFLLLTLNPFIPNAPFLYPLKTSEKPYDFLIFSGARERVHWEQMG